MSDNLSNVDEIFCAAIELPSPEEREEYVERACGGNAELRHRVDALLTAHFGAGDFLERSPATALLPDHENVQEGPGTLIGPYKLLEQIGEGGMGVVYMADQQAPVRRRVALKIIKAGMDTRQVIARFEAERQALALMDHSNIARVLDAGATESGRPYFVMELVRGIPITEYCDQNNLPVHERLELFVQVCSAVQHAHQKGIIHRDLKPSNVLVTLNDGRAVPKVIDFGVAKATGQQLTEKTLFTAFAQMVGTPLYMSPEQAEMTSVDIDTRSDIYSLGVLLYELLTGTTPFDQDRMRSAAFDEIRRIIREEEPPKPSTRISTLGESRTATAAHRQVDSHRLGRLMEGDLDWIVMKALEKDRTRRYDTAGNFAADVLRHLSDEPVEACPPSAVYRFRKFARRNKAVLAMIAVIAVSLMIATVVSLWRLQAERIARQEADRQRRAAREAQAEEAKQRVLAQVNARRAEANLRKAREAVDQMLSRVGKLSVGDPPRMEPVGRELLEDALKFYQGFLEQDSTDPELRLETARAWERLGEMHRDLGQFAQAQKAYDESVPILEKLVDEFSTEPTYRAALADSYNRLGDLFVWDFDDYERAEAMFSKAIALEEALVREFPNQPGYRERLAWMTRGLGESLQHRGRFDEAEKVLRRTVKISEELARDTSHRGGVLAGCYYYLGLLLSERKKDGEAEIAFREALAIYDPRGHGDHHSTHLGKWERTFLSDIHRRLAKRLHEAERNQEAEEHYRAAQAVAQKLLAEFPDGPGSHSSLAASENAFGEWLVQQHRVLEAEQLYRQALERTEAEAVEGQPLALPRVREIVIRLVSLLNDAQRPQEAEQVQRQATEFYEKLAADETQMRIGRGRLLRDSGEIDRAITDCDWIIAKDPKLAEAWDLRGSCYLRKGELTKVVENYTEAITLNPRKGEYWHERAYAYLMLGQHEKAIIDHTNAIEIVDHDAAQRLRRGRSYQALGELEKAEQDYSRAIELNPNHWENWYARGQLYVQQKQTDKAKVDLATAEQLGSTKPGEQNALAWWLATTLDQRLRNPDAAVELAKNAVAAAPNAGNIWNTLGVAKYRAGEWDDAIESLMKAEKLAPDKTLAFNGFFLAMAHWQLDHKDEARQWYGKSVAWMDKNQPKNEELLGFRAEAAELLGISERAKSTDAATQP